MKSLLFLFLSATAACAQSSGGPWAIKSATLDGGGGTSSDGIWIISGTTGQPDASAFKATGGPWTAQHGFWPGTVAKSGGPALTVAPLGVTRVGVSWPAAATGYKLQYSSDLTAWTDYPGLTISGASSIIWPLTSGPRYYFRLRKLP